LISRCGSRAADTDVFGIRHHLSHGGLMSSRVLVRPATVLRVILVAMVAAAVAAVALPDPAAAHGNVVNPASRNYYCWQRWGSDFQNPNMATEDPMCWQAWQANPNAMWNWNGLFREQVAGNHQAAIPDGQLCSAGHTESGRYNALDAVGAWKTTSISNNFQIKLYDQASHGADYIRVYVTRQGYNALTTPLAWSDLELVGQIGNTPAAQWTPDPAGGVSIMVGGSAPGRTGRHMVYTIWQASHLDQSYYFCSDVVFGGGTTPSPSTSASPSPSPSRSPSASPSRSTSPSPSSSPGSRTCSATYQTTTQWPGGFQGLVTVTAGASGVNGWQVNWVFANGQTVTQSWNAVFTVTGSSVSVRNTAWNSTLAGGASTSFGFLGSWNGTNTAPVPTCTALG
jgi:chitin-binding protein